MKTYFFLFIFFVNFCFAQQNLKLNFTPLKCQGTLPTLFTQQVQNAIKVELDTLKNSDVRDKKLRKPFIVAANYQIERIIRGGNTLLNDEVSEYLNQIGAIIRKDNPWIGNNFQFFALRSPVVNAYSFDKGYIFVDIGFIAQAESEAQLAYVLSHEIIHHVYKHSISGYVREVKIDRKKFDGKSYEDKLIEKCQYSRTTESEADVEGFKLFLKTNYNLKQAPKVFDVLEYSELPFELTEFNKSFFETPGYTIPAKYVLEKVSEITDHSQEDDKMHTHPNTAKRKVAIQELLAANSNEGRVNAIVGQQKFEYVRDLARMEMCKLYIKIRDYASALNSAYILSEKYPNNEFLKEIISKSMYAITLYQRGKIKYGSDSYVPDGIPVTREVEGLTQKFYYFVNNMPHNEWTIMSLNYVYRASKAFPQNKNIQKYSNELFRLMDSVEWGIKDFSRGIKATNKINDTVKERVSEKIHESKTDIIENLQKKKAESKTDTKVDTAYYQNIFEDLFVNDTVFAGKFPKRRPLNVVAPNGSFREGFSDVDDNNILLNNIKIDAAILLEPFYLRYNYSKSEELRYRTSDKKKEDYCEILNACAAKQGIKLISIDPSKMTAEDVDKLNDYTFINEWIDEKLDTRQKKSIMFNNEYSNEIQKKYGTKYVIKQGIVSVNFLHWTNTYFYCSVFDLLAEETVYKRYESLPDRDNKDLLYSKTHQVMYELAHPVKKISDKVK